LQCEVCGREVRELKKVMLDGTPLMVCSDCAKYGKEIYEVVQEPKRIITPPRVRREEIKRRRPRRERLEDYEIVEDYHMRIRRGRERLGITQEELAKKVMEKESVIHRIEAGRLTPSIKLAKKLERELGIRLIERIGEEEFELEEEELELTLGDVAEVKKRE